MKNKSGADKILEASECMEKILLDFGCLADYSLESIKQIENRFEEIVSSERVSSKSKDEFVFALGSYIGQTVIKVMGGFWIIFENKPQNSYIQILTHEYIMPFLRCEKRIANGEEESLYAYCSLLYLDMKKCRAETLAAKNVESKQATCKVKCKLSFADLFWFGVEGSFKRKNIMTYILVVIAFFAISFIQGINNHSTNEIFLISLANAFCGMFLLLVCLIFLIVVRSKNLWNKKFKYENMIILTQKHIINESPTSCLVFHNMELRAIKISRRLFTFLTFNGFITIIPNNAENKEVITEIIKRFEEKNEA